MDLQIEPGTEVWIIERDEDGFPCDISGYMFLAHPGGSVIVSPYINGVERLDDILSYHEQETVENYDTDLAVFPEEDCFTTKEVAFSAREEQNAEYE